MNLNYDRIKSRVEQGGHQWTSYSDLFLVLSVVFLLLFVVANLRSGATSLAQTQAVISAQQETENLRTQIKTYEVLKDNYLNEGASEGEVKVYRELMDQISLLESDASTKSKELSEQARLAKEKSDSLNRYQQLVKNIINANLVSSGKVKKRDLIIDGQSKELDVLDTQVQTKEREIEKNNREIARAQEELERKTAHLKQAYQSNKKSKVKYEAELRKLENESAEKITHLRKETQSFTAQLQDTRSKLDQKNREAQQLVTALSDKEKQFNSSIQSLTANHEAMLARERAAFHKELENAELSAEAKLEKERQYRAQYEKQTQEYQNGVAKLKADLAGTQQTLHQAEAKYQSSIKSLEKTNGMLQKDLEASNTKLNEQKKLAQQIQDGFAKAGIKANVDEKSGDVTILFDNEYFDSGKASLKPGMRQTLEKTIPSYARSLFMDSKIASKLNSVEIIGFASPTYKGKIVDPSSLTEEDRAAVNYNMDLSYQRAKSIFEYVFDPTKMQFENQKALLPMVKVSGKSYLSADKSESGRGLSSMKEYCQKFDCSKTQIVKIRFTLKGN